MVRGEPGSWFRVARRVRGGFRVAGRGLRGPRGSGRADPVLCCQLSLLMLSMFLVRNLDSRYEKLLRGL